MAMPPPTPPPDPSPKGPSRAAGSPEGIPWIVLGNPNNRRVTGFVEAIHRSGGTLDRVVSWRSIAADADILRTIPDAPRLVRIESAGEDDALQTTLRARGGGDPDLPLAFGQLLAPRAVHEGFLAVLSDLAAVAAERPGWILTAPIPNIARVFDKAAFHARCTALGVATATGLGPIASYDDLTRAMAAQPPGKRAFVKLQHGSSAVGIGLYRHTPEPRFLTTVRVTPNGWFNTRRLARISRPDRIREIVDGLCAEGVHAELEVPKASVGGAAFDLRVVAVAGEPAFTVARCSHLPITNLHLGGWRGDLDEIRARIPEEVWAEAMADVRRVASDYGGLHLGCDVLIERGYRGHRVIEANAFGDLLPGLVDAAGRPVYDAEIAAVPGWLAGCVGTSSTGARGRSDRGQTRGEGQD